MTTLLAALILLFPAIAWAGDFCNCESAGDSGILSDANSTATFSCGTPDPNDTIIVRTGCTLGINGDYSVAPFLITQAGGTLEVRNGADVVLHESGLICQAGAPKTCSFAHGGFLQFGPASPSEQDTKLSTNSTDWWLEKIVHCPDPNTGLQACNGDGDPAVTRLEWTEPPDPNNAGTQNLDQAFAAVDPNVHWWRPGYPVGPFYPITASTTSTPFRIDLNIDAGTADPNGAPLAWRRNFQTSLSSGTAAASDRTITVNCDTASSCWADSAPRTAEIYSGRFVRIYDPNDKMLSGPYLINHDEYDPNAGTLDLTLAVIGRGIGVDIDTNHKLIVERHGWMPGHRGAVFDPVVLTSASAFDANDPTSWDDSPVIFGPNTYLSLDGVVFQGMGDPEPGDDGCVNVDRVHFGNDDDVIRDVHIEGCGDGGGDDIGWGIMWEECNVGEPPVVTGTLSISGHDPNGGGHGIGNRSSNCSPATYEDIVVQFLGDDPIWNGDGGINTFDEFHCLFHSFAPSSMSCIAGSSAPFNTGAFIQRGAAPDNNMIELGPTLLDPFISVPIWGRNTKSTLEARNVFVSGLAQDGRDWSGAKITPLPFPIVNGYIEDLDESNLNNGKLQICNKNFETDFSSVFMRSVTASITVAICTLGHSSNFRNVAFLDVGIPSGAANGVEVIQADPNSTAERITLAWTSTPNEAEVGMLVRGGTTVKQITVGNFRSTEPLSRAFDLDAAANQLCAFNNSPLDLDAAGFGFVGSDFVRSVPIDWDLANGVLDNTDRDHPCFGWGATEAGVKRTNRIFESLNLPAINTSGEAGGGSSGSNRGPGNR